MEPYERIKCAIDHKRPDRTPIDYVATPEFNTALKRHMKLENDEYLLNRLGCDIRRVAGRYCGPAGTSGAAGVTAEGTDFLGITWTPVRNEFGVYNEITRHPLADATTVSEIENYAWPSVDWFDFSHLPDEIDHINKRNRYAIMFFAGGSFETPWYMRGMERFMMDLVECPDIAEAICSHATGFYKQRAMKAIEQSGGRIDIIGSGGDIGTQRGMMISPSLWRDYIKPYSTELISTFKKMGLFTFYHSCGSVIPVIEDFITMGLDILDPIQPKAYGMQPDNLTRLFGGRLTFHGGIDEQELLPRGTPQDVRDEMHRVIEILGKNGGYIACPAHAIQPDTPVENIVALYDAVRSH